MANWVCQVCGYVYDPSSEGGVEFENLPDSYVCPVCGVEKDQFEKID
jgi:Rubredoxin